MTIAPRRNDTLGGTTLGRLCRLRRPKRRRGRRRGGWAGRRSPGGGRHDRRWPARARALPRFAEARDARRIGFTGSPRDPPSRCRASAQRRLERRPRARRFAIIGPGASATGNGPIGTVPIVPVTDFRSTRRPATITDVRLDPRRAPGRVHEPRARRGRRRPDPRGDRGQPARRAVAADPRPDEPPSTRTSRRSRNAWPSFAPTGHARVRAIAWGDMPRSSASTG